MTQRGAVGNGRVRPRDGASSIRLCAKAPAELTTLERGSSGRIRVMRYPTREYQADPPSRFARLARCPLRPAGDDMG